MGFQVPLGSDAENTTFWPSKKRVSFEVARIFGRKVSKFGQTDPLPLKQNCKN